MTVRVIALGNRMAGDDGAALVVAERLAGEPDVDLRLAGRPGTGLLDLLDPAVPTLVLDVVRRGAAPGALVELRLDELVRASVEGQSLSSHDLGVADAFRLAEALDRELPDGLFLGMGGETFDPGTELTPHVARRLPDYEIAARAAISALRSRIELR